MIWTIDQEPENGIMFKGQSTVRVKNRRGDTGVAKVEYYPTVQVVGPVIGEGQDDAIDFDDETNIIDRRPTFRS